MYVCKIIKRNLNLKAILKKKIISVKIVEWSLEIKYLLINTRESIGYIIKRKMNEEQLKQKIKEVERQLEISEINMVTIDYYDKLLQILHALWDLLYFKTNQEKTFLDPPKEDDEEKKGDKDND